MGVTGLLPQLKPIQNSVSLNRYSGQTLAIDGYAWLHRASCSCALELALGMPTDKYLKFFIKKFSMLRSFNIEPFLVFDGDSLPAKKGTELKRRGKRKENREIAERLWKSGEKRNAIEYFQKCVDITPEMAKCIIDYCKIHSIKYMVAPFEADPQMVYLEKKNLVQGIISEDSDLLVFGCRRLITKLNDFGECIEICRDDFNKLPVKFPLGDLLEEERRVMVCLAGCDYTTGLPKVGLIKAIKLVKQFKTMEKILLNLQRENKIKIPDDFDEQYQKATFAFKFQRVFCPMSQRITSLNQIPEESVQLLQNNYDMNELFATIGLVIHNSTNTKQCIFNEDDINHELHAKITYGEINPYNSQQPLLNREHKLRLTAKPTNKHEIRKDFKTNSIDSFFSKSQVSVKSNVTVVEKRVLKPCNTLDKLTQTIKKRKLSKPIISNITSTPAVKTSKFFSKTDVAVNQATDDVSYKSLGGKTEVSSQNEEIKTVSPDSEVSTQISSSYEYNDNNRLQKIASISKTELLNHQSISDDSSESLSDLDIEENVAECLDRDSSGFLNSDDGTDRPSQYSQTETQIESQSQSQNENAKSRPSLRATSFSSSILQQFKYAGSQKMASVEPSTNNVKENCKLVRKPLAPSDPNIIKNGNISVKKSAIVIEGKENYQQKSIAKSFVKQHPIASTFSVSQPEVETFMPPTLSSVKCSTQPAPRSISSLSQYIYKEGS